MKNYWKVQCAATKPIETNPTSAACIYFTIYPICIKDYLHSFRHGHSPEDLSTNQRRTKTNFTGTGKTKKMLVKKS